MAIAETANLIVKLSLGGNFTSQIGKATAGLGKLEKGSNRAYRAGQQIGTGIKRSAALAAVGIGLLATQVAQGLDSLIKLEGMTAQTEAVLKSTGSVAGVTAGQVRKLAEQYEAINATVGDELIQNAENLLLTFTNVRTKAFEPALQAALDMNQALGGGPEGLAGTVKLVGKALQDPEKGLSRLGRAVGGFSEETVKAVKAALKQNDTLGAQNIILAELEKRYGGSFARAGKTTAARVAKFTDSVEDLQRALAEALLPTLGNVADALSKTLADPAVVAGVRDFGRSLADMISPANIAEGGRVISDIINAARTAAPVVAGVAKTIGTAIGTAVNLFRSLPPELQTLLVGAFAVNKITGGLVTNVAGGLVGAVLNGLKNVGAMHVTAGVVHVGGGIPGVGGPGMVPGIPGWDKGAGVGGGLKGLIQGLPIIGIGVIAAEASQAIGRAVLDNVKPLLREAGVPTSPVEDIGINAGGFAVDLLSGHPLDALGKLPLIAADISKFVGLIGANGLPTRDDRGTEGMRTTADATEKVRAAALETKRETTKGAAFTGGKISQTTSAVGSAASTIVAGFAANRPIISVNVSSTSITKVTEVNNRYGVPLASRNIRQGAD